MIISQFFHFTELGSPNFEAQRINQSKIEESKSPNLDNSSMVRNEMSSAIHNIDKHESDILNSNSVDMSVQHESTHKAKETSEQQERRIRKESIFGHLKTWKLLRIIVKSGDDLRQEQFAMQLISQIDQIFKREKLNIWLKPYEILATGKDCGLIEFLADAMSIDAIKKKTHLTLEDYFKNNFPSRSKLK